MVINGIECMTTEQLNTHFQVILTSDFITKQLGVSPILKNSTTSYWREADFPIIANRLAAKVNNGTAGILPKKPK